MCFILTLVLLALRNKFIVIDGIHIYRDDLIA